MQLRITPRAQKQSLSLLSYLLEEFGQKTRNDFRTKLVQYFDTIQNEPLAFPILKENIHRAVITKQTTIIYRVNLDHNHIEILSLFDSRKNPSRLIV